MSTEVLCSTICDFLRNLLNDISCQVTEEVVRRIATCIIDTVAKNGVQIGEWVINSITNVLALIRRGLEVAYNSTKSILKEFYEAIKATACFIGRLTEALAFTGWNFILYCIRRISGNEFVCRTRQHVDNILNPSAKPIIGATVGVGGGAVTGAVIGSVVPVIGTVAGGVIGGLAGFIGGSFVGVVVARNT